MAAPASEDKIIHVCQILDGSGIPYVVIGGVALSVWGDPRLTYDMDFLVYLPDDSAIRKLLDHCDQAGLSIDREKALETFKTHRGFVGKSGDLDMDFLVAGSLYETELYGRRRIVPYHGINLALPSPEDLILLKIMASRDKDKMDIKNIVQRQGDGLDRRYIEKWIDQFDSRRPEKPFREIWKQII